MERLEQGTDMLKFLPYSREKQGTWGIFLLLFRAHAYFQDTIEVDHPTAAEFTNYISGYPH